MRRCGARRAVPSAMNTPFSCSTLLLSLLLAVFPHPVFAVPTQSPDALSAAVDAGTPAEARAVLAALADGHPVLRLCNTNGVA